MPEIPLFPLPLVLFPQVVVPLHIFEERYKLMINRCVDESLAFGIVLLTPGSSSESEETIKPIGVTARIVQSERLADGRLNIMAAGEKRFRIVQFLGSSPYWSANVRFLEDDESGDELPESRNEVARIYREVHKLAAELRGVEVPEVSIPESALTLSFMVSYVLDIPPEAKQELLEMSSVTGRLKALVVHLEGTLQSIRTQIAREKISNKVKGNGHFAV